MGHDHCQTCELIEQLQRLCQNQERLHQLLTDMLASQGRIWDAILSLAEQSDEGEAWKQEG